MNSPQKTPNSLTIFTVIATLALLTTSSLRAGEVTNVNWFSGVGSVAATTFSPPVAPNNDDVVGASPNQIFVYQKDFIGIGPVDLRFGVKNTGGVTEYLVTEGVLNNTGLNWGSYHIELGFGIGAGFVKSTPGDGLDFDFPDFNSPFFFNPSPGFFPSVAVTSDDIFASGGVMPNFTYAGNFIFTIDVPDNISSFTIRQSPIPVPEPATGALLGLSSLALVLLKKRK